MWKSLAEFKKSLKDESGEVIGDWTKFLVDHKDRIVARFNPGERITSIENRIMKSIHMKNSHKVELFTTSFCPYA